MLVIDVKEQEFYDSEKQMFFNTKPITVRLEHSLISIAKWESHWEKPYFPSSGRSEGVKGGDEEIHYIKCMIIGNVPDYIPRVLLESHSEELKNYIRKKHSATTIHRRGKPAASRQIITVELIYYWMIKYAIPKDCEMWHFNRLLMLIDVCNIKESSGKKGNLSSLESAKERSVMNKARRAAA